MTQEISKRIELDYGHTLSQHFGFCNQIHGHRATVIAYFSGEIDNTAGSSSQGMIIDFTVCKAIMMEHIHKVLDHGFAVWKDEKDFIEIDGVQISVLKFIQARNKKVLVTTNPPTAEYLAQWAFFQIHEALKKVQPNVKLSKVEWYETPSGMASFSARRNND